MMNFPAPPPLAKYWNLSPTAVFLNHGSYGATPRAVLEAQHRYQILMEEDPVLFFLQNFDEWLDRARLELSKFVGCQAQDLVFISNATTGVATIFSYLEKNLCAGDEILTNNFEHLACQNNLKRFAAKTGAKIISAEIPFAVESNEQIIKCFYSKISPKTKMALISHTTSSTARTFPIESLIPQFEKSGVITLMDGAHGVGFTELNLEALQASFYVSNCHKWLCAPKGSAFIYVNPKYQEDFRPLVLSNFSETSKKGRAHFQVEFDFVGTADYTSWICIPETIRILAEMVEGGWPEILKRNRNLTLQARKLLCDYLGTEPVVSDEQVRSMAIIPLPAYSSKVLKKFETLPTKYGDSLQDRLIEKYSIQVPVWKMANHRYLRISCHLYNSLDQYRYLAECLRTEIL